MGWKVGGGGVVGKGIGGSGDQGMSRDGAETETSCQRHGCQPGRCHVKVNSAWRGESVPRMERDWRMVAERPLREMTGGEAEMEREGKA